MREESRKFQLLLDGLALEIKKLETTPPPKKPKRDTVKAVIPKPVAEIKKPDPNEEALKLKEKEKEKAKEEKAKTKNGVAASELRIIAMKNSDGSSRRHNSASDA